jgi:hypothetical protein
MSPIARAFTESLFEFAETGTTCIKDKMTGMLGLLDVLAGFLVGSANQAWVVVTTEGGQRKGREDNGVDISDMKRSFSHTE